MKKLYIYAIAILAYCCVYTSLAIAEDVGFERQPITIHTASGDKTFNTEIAITGQQLENGLMFRKKLPENEAMLFIFKDIPNISMWMKNTLISLDMLFFGEDGKIVYIKHDAKPESLEAISPGNKKVIAVMEIAGGVAKKQGIVIGDKLINCKACGQ